MDERERIRAQAQINARWGDPGNSLLGVEIGNNPETHRNEWWNAVTKALEAHSRERRTP